VYALLLGGRLRCRSVEWLAVAGAGAGAPLVGDACDAGRVYLRMSGTKCVDTSQVQSRGIYHCNTFSCDTDLLCAEALPSHIICSSRSAPNLDPSSSGRHALCGLAEHKCGSCRNLLAITVTHIKRLFSPSCLRFLTPWPCAPSEATHTSAWVQMSDPLHVHDTRLQPAAQQNKGKTIPESPAEMMKFANAWENSLRLGPYQGGMSRSK
jgi:hypothetical protein